MKLSKALPLVVLLAGSLSLSASDTQKEKEDSQAKTQDNNLNEVLFDLYAYDCSPFPACEVDSTQSQQSLPLLLSIATAEEPDDSE